MKIKKVAVRTARAVAASRRTIIFERRRVYVARSTIRCVLVWLGGASCDVNTARFGDSPALTTEWTHYGGDAAGSRYSTVAQIDRQNVSTLGVTWMIRTGELRDSVRTVTFDRQPPTEAAGVASRCAECYVSQARFESTPIFWNGLLYLNTPRGRVLALDPETGALRWEFDPNVDITRWYAEGLTSRGVAVWEDSRVANAVRCSRRIIFTTVDARLFAVDASVGRLCLDFGAAGVVRLDLQGSWTQWRTGDYSVTSAPVVVGNNVIIGSAVNKNRTGKAPSGLVRAYDARLGHLVWSFEPLATTSNENSPAEDSRDRGEAGGGANVWSTMSSDVNRDLVYLPTSSAAPGFFGGARPGRNEFANSIVALQASTGKLVWFFQTVHHDLWDYDVASQPVLITLSQNGHNRPAVVVGTKTGMIFVFDRVTGEALAPIVERSVPRTDVPGESVWPTQPFSGAPLLHGNLLTPDSAFGVTEADRSYCRQLIGELRNEGLFTPPSLTGTLMWPGFWGGMNWDGMAWDPERQLIVTTVRRLGMVVRLHPRNQRPAVGSESSLAGC